MPMIPKLQCYIVETVNREEAAMMAMQCWCVSCGILHSTGSSGWTGTAELKGCVVMIV